MKPSVRLREAATGIGWGLDAFVIEGDSEAPQGV
jgi:hypothetical protein